MEAAAVTGAVVVVVDNKSDDDSKAVCEKHFPSTTFLTMPENKVLVSYNDAAKHCTQEVLVFLNNDVIVDRNFLPPLLKQLSGKDDVFSVSPCVMPLAQDGRTDAEMEYEVPVWSLGMLRGVHKSSDTATKSRYTMGGAMACNRAKFIELGGFDDLYLLGYHEDVDLSWRAWKRGWRCMYEPRSVVYHAGGASMGRSKAIKTLQARNEFLFHWKNLSAPSLLAWHVSMLIPRIALAILRGDGPRVLGFLHALKRLPKAYRSRRSSAAMSRRSDIDAITAMGGKALGTSNRSRVH